MHGYSWFKNRFPRVIDSIFYFTIVFIGIVGVIVVTQYTNKLQEVHQAEVSELIELKESVDKEEQVSLDIETLFSKKGVSLKDGDEIESIIRQLPEGESVTQITIGNDAGTYGVYIQYDVSDYAKQVNDTKLDQNILVNSVILMSLCKDINTIDVNIIADKSIEDRLFYRKDIEEYLGRELSLEMEDSITYFEKNAYHFFNRRNMNDYIQYNTSYKSEVSRDIDKFYKSNFPITNIAEDGHIPYIPENLGDELIKEYGEQLFVEGLKYDNEYINYYSIYRLLEFYGTEHLEEIILELEICKNKTDSEDIKLACDYVSSIFTHSDYDTPVWVTRYMENNAGGGTKIYRLYKNKLQLWAVFEQPTSVKTFITSTDNQKVWCSASSQGSNFIFVLPVEQDETIYITPNENILLGEISYPEIMTLVKNTLEAEGVYKQGINLASNILASWYADSYICITTTIDAEEYELLYNTENKMIRLYSDNLENMKIEEFLYKLSYLGELTVQDTSLDGDDISMKKVYINDDCITVYPGDINSEAIQSVKESYSNLISADLEESPKVYQNNNLLVSYVGDKTNIINELNKIFKVSQ